MCWCAGMRHETWYAGWQDARDVVDLLTECLLDAVTLDSGEIDFGRRGGMSMAKQVSVGCLTRMEDGMAVQPA